MGLYYFWSLRFDLHLHSQALKRFVSLSHLHPKGKFTEGQRIRIGNEEGTIVRIDSISVTLQQEKQQLIFPSKRLVEEEVIILSDAPNEDN